MEPNDPATDKVTETPEQDQGVQLGDATPLESEPDLQEADEKPAIDESALSIEERNIRNSPNIAAPTTGPTEEEIAERKHQEEMAKLDEIKPIVNETLIDNGSSMERKKRRPLVITFVIVAILAIAGIAGVMLFTNKEKPTKEIKTPVIHYTEEVKVGVDSRVKTAFDEVAGTISNFEKITATTPENNVFSTKLLADKQYDLLITTNYEEGIIDPGEDPTYVPITVTPFLNDAIVLIANKDLPLSSIKSTDVSDIYGGTISSWTAIEGVEYEEEEPADHTIKQYYTDDNALAMDIYKYVTTNPRQSSIEESAEDTAAVVEKVSEDIDGIAFVRLSELTVDMLNTIKLLDVDSTTASNDTVSDASYPYTIRYYIISLSNLDENSVPAAYLTSLTDNAGNSSTMKKGIQKSDCHHQNGADETNGDVTDNCAKYN